MNLKAFCADFDERYTFTRIMAYGGWVYATDCHIAIRIPATKETQKPRDDDSFPSEQIPILFKRDFSLCTVPFPPLSGETYRDYDECECGMRDPDCQLCDGTGTWYFDIPYDMVLGATIIAGRLLKRILDNLKNVRYFCDGDPETPLLFVADGDVQGIVAPLRRSAHLSNVR